MVRKRLSDADPALEKNLKKFDYYDYSGWLGINAGHIKLEPIR